jgi:hypothetical protein
MFENRPHWADKAFWWVAPIVILASAGGGLFYYYHSKNKAEAPPAPAAVKPPPSAEPAIKHPVPQPSSSADNAGALPTLNESDAPLQTALGKVFGADAAKKLLMPDGLVRRIVVTVDNLPRQKVAVEKRPLKALDGETLVHTEADLTLLSDANYARYTPLVKLVDKSDMQQLANLYFSYYPLFQQTYEDLGYPGQYFNDRLVEAIDSLLAAPDLPGAVLVVQPRVFYEFADPKLEGRPAGQKLMMRMGRANEAVVKAKLRELRKIVTTGRDPPDQRSDAK